MRQLKHEQRCLVLNEESNFPLGFGHKPEVQMLDLVLLGMHSIVALCIIHLLDSQFL